MNQPAQGDENLAVRFYMGTRLNKAETEKQGRPIYDSLEMCEIKFPGDRTRVVAQPAQTLHFGGTPPREWTYAERFADIYEKFKSDGDQVLGTPLSEFPAMTEGQRQTYRAAGINSVEKIANMDGRTIRSMGMGAQALREQAISFLEVSKGTADVASLRREIEELRAQVGVTKKQAEPVDPYAPYDDEDLKNMIRDAGGEVPKGRAGRDKLIAALEEAQTEAA